MRKRKIDLRHQNGIRWRKKNWMMLLQAITTGGKNAKTENRCSSSKMKKSYKNKNLDTDLTGYYYDCP